ncbi:unnamed protein product [Clonostachys rosea f. rosea IK726]|uniref:O-methyltransferase C-terminal domain-containing protein n=2 Tax=Bionectria ochroleuca TaxID=29856 RepID=A0A0B7K936_BIOOC|nr:unnamed protein product [Clonostachys rosea f. rosea IK726]
MATNGEAKTPQVSVVSATDPAAVPGLIKELSALAEKFDPANVDDNLRLDLALKARTLWKSLETPRETMIRHNWAQPAAFTALTAGTQKGVWTYLDEHDGPFVASKVAEALNITPAVWSRLARHLGAMGYLKEIAPDTYERTNFTKAMSVPIIGQSYPVLAGGCFAALDHFHEYQDKVGWTEPNDVANGPYQAAFNTKLNFFEYLQANPPYGVQFNYHMGGYHQGRPSWMDPGFFPVKENLIDGFEDKEGSAFLVDIGGSVGHDIEELYQKYPQIPGRLVLQDLPLVISQIEKLDDRIERMAYDFHTEQPVKEARAYYMHSVLHDWPEEVCLKILANITAAMKPGYSKVLINENVIPDTGAQWEATGLDIMMMTLLSSRERTRENWETLLTKANLKIVKVWTARNGAESLIECELA